MQRSCGRSERFAQRLHVNAAADAYARFAQVPHERGGQLDRMHLAVIGREHARRVDAELRLDLSDAVAWHQLTAKARGGDAVDSLLRFRFILLAVNQIQHAPPRHVAREALSQLVVEAIAELRQIADRRQFWALLSEPQTARIRSARLAGRTGAIDDADVRQAALDERIGAGKADQTGADDHGFSAVGQGIRGVEDLAFGGRKGP
ncbi:MAG: hypothetical protein R2748_32090 [Bryobacterales bacterium]